MTDTERLEDLRRLMLSAPEAGVTRVLAIIVGLTLVAVVLWLVRGRRLREEYTPIWMAAGFSLAIISLRFDLLQALTRAIGAWTASATVFFVGQVFLTALSLNYAVRLSRTGVQVKNLAQEIALLRARLEENSPGESGTRPTP
jgi:hypothetical protein